MCFTICDASLAFRFTAQSRREDDHWTNPLKLPVQYSRNCCMYAVRCRKEHKQCERASARACRCKRDSHSAQPSPSISDHIANQWPYARLVVVLLLWPRERAAWRPTCAGG